MGYYTKTGDGGETSLFDGTRVSKDDPRIGILGELDELTSLLGWCRSAGGHPIIIEKIAELQRELYLSCAEIAMPPSSRGGSKVAFIEQEHYARLESWIDQAIDMTGPIDRFILPGGTELASRLHLARTCCRRVERSMVMLSRTTKLREELLIYINRLSDLLFAWSRLANKNAGVPDDV